jgi:hypothetical protein
LHYHQHSVLYFGIKKILCQILRMENMHGHHFHNQQDVLNINIMVISMVIRINHTASTQPKNPFNYTDGSLKTTPSLETKYSILTWDLNPHVLQRTKWDLIIGDARLIRIILNQDVKDLKLKKHRKLLNFNYANLQTLRPIPRRSVSG